MPPLELFQPFLADLARLQHFLQIVTRPDVLGQTDFRVSDLRSSMQNKRPVGAFQKEQFPLELQERSTDHRMNVVAIPLVEPPEMMVQAVQVRINPLRLVASPDLAVPAIAPR